MTKFSIHRSVIKSFILNPDKHSPSTPEGAILRKAHSDGIKFRDVKGGWAEFNENSKTWIAGKVCMIW